MTESKMQKLHITPKPVKAWAVVDDLETCISPSTIHYTKRDAEYSCFIRERVIPVTIVPGHGGKDE